MKYFLKNYWAMKYLVYGLLGYEIFFEKFVKPSGSHSYILNVRSLMLTNIQNIHVKTL